MSDQAAGEEASAQGAGAERQLASFIARFDPAIAALGSAMLADLRARYPAANLLAYDNYNALAVGLAPGDKASGVALSVAFYPRWVSLFLMRGTSLQDPAGLLEGSGKGIRHIKFHDIAAFRRPEVAVLTDQAIALAEPPFDPAHRGRLVIKSVSAKQRPRRPA